MLRGRKHAVLHADRKAVGDALQFADHIDRGIVVQKCRKVIAVPHRRLKERVQDGTFVAEHLIFKVAAGAVEVARDDVVLRLHGIMEDRIAAHTAAVQPDRRIFRNVPFFHRDLHQHVAEGNGVAVHPRPRVVIGGDVENIPRRRCGRVNHVGTGVNNVPESVEIEDDPADVAVDQLDIGAAETVVMCG